MDAMGRAVFDEGMGSMSDDPLDPQHLALVTPWTFDAWRRALDKMWAEGLSREGVLALVNSGLTPRQIPAVLKYIKAESTWRIS